MPHRRQLTVFSILIIVLTLVVAGGGLLLGGGEGMHEVRNQFDEPVVIYGTGAYSRDSLFKAPIFRGTDLIMLLFAVPLTLAVTFAPKSFGGVNRALILSSLYGVFLYYSAGLALGASFNYLFLVYVALFSVSLLALAFSLSSLDWGQIGKLYSKALPFTGFNVFLVLTGAALILAWMPDIIPALASGGSLKLIEVYTTEVTYVLDMGIIGPSAIVAIFMLKGRKPAGIVALAMLLVLCSMVGIMMPAQSIFQFAAGVEIPIPVLLTKSLTFVLLAAYASWLLYRLVKAARDLG